MPVEPSQPGRIPCMSCGKEFKSPDRMRIRRCNKCKKKDAELSARELGVSGGDWPAGVHDELWREQ